MTAPGNTWNHTRAEDERRRAARTAKIAERHEGTVVAEPFLQAFHLRMATIHRQVQHQHLVAAALQAAHADRIRTWSEVAGGYLRRGPAAGEDRPPLPHPADRHGGDVAIRPGSSRPRSERVGPRGRRECRRTLGVTTSASPLATHSEAYTFLVTLTESLEADGDVARFSSRFISRCLALLDVTDAAILLADHRGSLRTAVWTSERARLFLAAELSGGAGPSVECHLAGDRRSYPTTWALAARWPGLAGTARAAHIAAVYALALRRRDDAFGVLTLLDSRPRRLSDEALQLADLLADAAAVGLANQRNIDYHQRVTAQLQSALTSRVAIEQAKGILAERLGIPVDAAFDLLRNHARGSSRNLHEVAAEIVDRSLDIVSRGSDRTAPSPRTPPPR